MQFSETEIWVLIISYALVIIMALITAVLLINNKRKSKQLQILQTSYEKEIVKFEERERITADLHDDLGSYISIIRLKTELLQNANTAPQKQADYIKSIEENVTGLSSQMSLVIWSMNVKNDSLQSLCEYIKNYVYHFLESVNFNFEYSETIEIDRVTPINSIARKNLFLTVKEIVNNAVKHSAATLLTMKINTDSNALKIIITDNGKGLQNENKLGNGLLNIEKRILAINGNIDIQVNDGTSFTLTYPLSF